MRDAVDSMGHQPEYDDDTVTDRRRSPRVAIVGSLQGTTIPPDATVTVLDMSLGGMAIEVSVPFTVGDIHDFELTLGDGAAVVLRGRIVHSRPVAGPAPDPLYAVGVQFVDDDDGDNADVGGLLQRIE